MTDIDAVREYYESFDEHEWHRLDSGEGRLEFAVTCALLDPVLPASGRVLDLGGGPGRYTQWLATRGMQVTLADLSPTMLDIARAKLPSGTANEIIETDARNLSRWNADHSDVTLALGPFYHLTAAADREQALSEIIRVTAPGGVIAVALMPRYGYLRRTLAIADERHRMADAAFTSAVLLDGIFRNDIAGRFTEGFGVDSAQIAAPFEAAGLETILIASTHGFATGVEDEVDTLRIDDPAAYSKTLELLIETASDPSLFGTAGHLLYVGRHSG